MAYMILVKELLAFSIAVDRGKKISDHLHSYSTTAAASVAAKVLVAARAWEGAVGGENSGGSQGVAGSRCHGRGRVRSGVSGLGPTATAAALVVAGKEESRAVGFATREGNGLGLEGGRRRCQYFLDN
ncbi:hypothetical protein E2562_029916 [Oryza meyeriana var. granulata]|uniref:Uncharacterized protein n=1 Tax=Oryza meyeriana var. granulata TaxID=110450 RepID=A0A6G1CUQ6_9ORYZ|nr:hypothetical protein E2562_029916 [Oryza meyeriana var. granulata]